MPSDRRSFSLRINRRKVKLKQVEKASRSFELSVGGVAQSVVSLADPRRLAYPYVRHIARMIDVAAPAGEAVRAVHLGAGGLTLPRYVAATRPGSAQVVVEFEREVCEAVLEALPLPEGSGIRLLYGDARALAEAPVEASVDPDGSDPDGSWSDAAFTVVDLWDAAIIRAHVASREFYALVAGRSAPDGVMAVNLLDGHPFDYARRQAATLASLFAHVAVVLDFEPEDDEGPLGNVVVVGSDAPLAVAAHPELLGEPRPHLLHGDELTRWIGGATPMTDADATDSPDPDDPRWA
ncbi:spermidine synthase [Herbiconiux sp. P15]|uniref:spermidine synthase n=1 Tax=Herbiconiux liukaitaii TaxID=3342799 RepID=UPI0035B83B3C